MLALTPALSPRRERSELLSRLAPLNPPASGARDVPARSGSECNRRLGEGSGTSRLSEPLRPGTGRAPKEGSWAGNSHSPRCKSRSDGKDEMVETRACANRLENLSSCGNCGSNYEAYVYSGH